MAQVVVPYPPLGVNLEQAAQPRAETLAAEFAAAKPLIA